MCSWVVLGGGPAGIFAALRLAGQGLPVELVEANTRLGVKLAITGGGNCNLTQYGGIPEFLRAFPKEQARFLKASLHGLTPADVMAFFQDRGLALQTREDGRVFPQEAPGGARLVVNLLREALEAAGVRLRTGCRVAGLEASAPRIEALRLEEGGFLEGEAFVLATGGASYATTGSRGEAPGWLAPLGIPVAPWAPALAPILLNAPRPAWQGVALRGGRLWVQESSGRRLGSFSGDLLFTRQGLTGPAVLGLSREVAQAMKAGEVRLSYQGLEGAPEALDALLIEAQRQDGARRLRNWLKGWLPERVVDDLMREAGLPLDQRMRDLPKATRRLALEWLWALPLGAPVRVDLTRGEVCAGGVCLKAVDPNTMAVKGWENLRICGELLDLDGPIGGYNLQVAFSTGWAAGSRA